MSEHGFSLIRLSRYIDRMQVSVRIRENKGQRKTNKNILLSADLQCIFFRKRSRKTEYTRFLAGVSSNEIILDKCILLKKTCTGVSRTMSNI